MDKQKLIKLRCKAWGITEDEYYCNQCSDFSLEDMARAYRRGKNKGASDTAIQNGRFYQKQMQDIYDKKNKQIAELEAQIEKMKCCGNCIHCYEGAYHNGYRCKDHARESVCDNWEMMTDEVRKEMLEDD